MLWPELVDDREGDEEYKRRDSRESDERKINDAVEFAAGAAVFAFREVGFVVAAHFGEDARNVVSPAGENIPDDLIRTLRFQSATKT